MRAVIYLISSHMHNELHQRLFIPIRQSVLHRFEFRDEDVDVAVQLLFCFFLCQTDKAQRWLNKTSGSHLQQPKRIFTMDACSAVKPKPVYSRLAL